MPAHPPRALNGAQRTHHLAVSAIAISVAACESSPARLAIDVKSGRALPIDASLIQHENCQSQHAALVGVKVGRAPLAADRMEGRVRDANLLHGSSPGQQTTDRKADRVRDTSLPHGSSPGQQTVGRKAGRVLDVNLLRGGSPGQSTAGTRAGSFALGESLLNRPAHDSCGFHHPLHRPGKHIASIGWVWQQSGVCWVAQQDRQRGFGTRAPSLAQPSTPALPLPYSPIPSSMPSGQRRVPV